MATANPAPLSACRLALIRDFASSNPEIVVDEKGYVSEACRNLIEGVRLIDFEADLLQGDGNEMEGKFLAVHSSSALVVNTFAPFKSDPAALKLPGGSRFKSLGFERKCPHGLVGRRPPNLDMVAEGAAGVVAVESKFLEPLTPHKARFSPAYDAEIKDGRRGTAWFREMQRLIEEPHTYRWLDAGQLVKHAFGVAFSFSSRPATLLYLFWEPSNPEAFPVFAEHRAEVKQFAASVAGGGPEFVAMSYPDLWKWWDACAQAGWLRAHVCRLRARYGISV